MQTAVFRGFQKKYRTTFNESGFDEQLESSRPKPAGSGRQWQSVDCAYSCL
jgi:hypothetical protein